MKALEIAIYSPAPQAEPHNDVDRDGGAIAVGDGWSRPATAPLWHAPLPPQVEAMSPRERQVLSLLRTGLSRKEVAYELGINDATVRVFLFRAQRKARRCA